MRGKPQTGACVSPVTQETDKDSGLELNFKEISLILRNNLLLKKNVISVSDDFSVMKSSSQTLGASTEDARVPK